MMRSTAGDEKSIFCSALTLSSRSWCRSVCYVFNDFSASLNRFYIPKCHQYQCTVIYAARAFSRGCFVKGKKRRLCCIMLYLKFITRKAKKKVKSGEKWRVIYTRNPSATKKFRASCFFAASLPRTLVSVSGNLFSTKLLNYVSFFLFGAFSLNSALIRNQFLFCSK